MTLDESVIHDLSAPNAEEDDDDDIEMKESEVVIKEEKSEIAGDNQLEAEDDDDVMIMPQEEPVVTEILDEAEHARGDLNITDDDVMIQEPKIETQLVDDDDDDDEYQPSMTFGDSATGLIVKIKEEPKDDGYEDLVNEEDDAFVEVTAIANDDLIGEFSTNQKLRVQTNTKFKLFHDSQTILSPTRPKLHSNRRKMKTLCLMIHRC